MLRVVEKQDERKAGEELLLLDEIARAGARRAGAQTQSLLMTFKLLHMARQRWRRLDGAHLLPPVPTSVKFVDGVRDDPAQPITQSTDNLTGEAACS